MTKANKDLPRHIRWEIAQLAQFGPVITESIAYVEHPSGAVAIAFDIETDIQLEPTDTPILDVEPVLFEYRDASRIGKIAPRVLSARSDFPRNLSHINPGSRSQPVSLCVARAGHQAIYDASGVVGIAHRTLSWLNDAKCESLYEDGWDPVPNGTLEHGVIGHFDAKALQAHAASNPEGGIAFGAAAVTRAKSDSVLIHAESPLIELSDPDEIANAKKAMAISNTDPCDFHTFVPIVFCWPPRSSVEHDPHFNEWVDMEGLLAGLHATSLYDDVDKAFLMLDPLFSENQDWDMRNHKAILLVIGLWRPAPLDPTIVGLATDRDARCLELRTFYLQRDRGVSDRWSTSTDVRPFFCLVPALPEILEAVSGETALGHTTVLGAGALGSAILTYAVRGGTDRLTVVDDDVLLSHNMARHRASRYHVGQNKAELTADLVLEWAQDVRVTPQPADITTMTELELQTVLQDSERVFDATANPLVRRQLSTLSSPVVPVMRSEIFHHGCLGVTLMARIGEIPNLNHLFHQLVALGMRNEWVKEWLAYEASRSFLDEELLLGFGCRSLTTKMPAYKIDSHAATAFALAKNRSASASAVIALHRLDEHGVSEGTLILEADSVIPFDSPKTTSGWTVFVTQPVLDQLHALRLAAAPKETGGYLFGAIDDDLSQIHIIAASPEPPGTVASETALELGPWGQTGFEKTFMRRTRNRLPPVGTWHSHPASAPTASAKDHKTVESFKLEDAAKGLPTVMAITGQQADAVYVLEA